MYFRTSQEDDLPTSPNDKWIGTATTPAKATLAYQRHALNILALVTESTVEIFNFVPCLDDDDLAADAKDEIEVGASKGGEKEREPCVFAKDGQEVVSNIQDCARRVLSSELVCDLLPRLFSDIGEFDLKMLDLELNGKCVIHR